MAAEFEKKIQHLLSEKDAALVADELMKLWNSGALSTADKNHVIHFLVLSGYHTTLKNKLVEEISQNTPVQWKALFFFLQQIPISDSQADALFVGLTEDQALETLLNFRSLQKQNPRFAKVYQDLLHGRIKIKNAEMTQLLSRLKLALNDKDAAEIARLTDELKKRFSYDEEVRDLTVDIDLAKAKKILKKKEQELSPLKDLADPVYRTQEFQNLAQMYLQKAQSDSSLAYNLAISLFQMEAYNEALEVLELSPDSESKDWLKIELLILNKKFIETLDFSFSLETKYLKNPETVFETLYFRSLALFELNDKEKARSILEKIIDIKPEHIKSRIKLSEWKDSI